MPQLAVSTLVLLLLLLILPLALAAEEADWRGEGAIGFLSASGNSDSGSFNARLSLARESQNWAHALNLDSYTADEQGSRTAERYSSNLESRYQPGHHNFLYGGLRYENDRFGAFDYQTALTAGIGRRLFVNETQEAVVKLGAGYRVAEQPVDPEADDPDLRDETRSVSGMVADLGGAFRWLITPHLSLSTNLAVEPGAKNTHVDSDTALTVKLSENLSAKLAYQLLHNTEAPKGRSGTDRFSSLSLVYGF